MQCFISGQLFCPFFINLWYKLNIAIAVRVSILNQNETNIKMSQYRAKHFWIEMNLCFMMLKSVKITEPRIMYHVSHLCLNVKHIFKRLLHESCHVWNTYCLKLISQFRNKSTANTLFSNQYCENQRTNLIYLWGKLSKNIQKGGELCLQTSN